METAPVSEVLVPAPKLARFGAHVVDTALLATLCYWAALFHTGSDLLFGLSFLAAATAVLACPVLTWGATLGQLACGLRLVGWPAGGPAPAAKVLQWAGTKQLLIGFGLYYSRGVFESSLFPSLFFLTILTDKHARSLYDDWADVYVVKKAGPGPSA